MQLCKGIGNKLWKINAISCNGLWSKSQEKLRREFPFNARSVIVDMLHKKVTLKLDTFPHIKTGRGNPGEGKGSQGQERVRNISHPSLTVSSSMKAPSSKAQLKCREPSSDPCRVCVTSVFTHDSFLFSFTVFLLLLLSPVLGLELRALHVLGRGSTAERPQPLTGGF